LILALPLIFDLDLDPLPAATTLPSGVIPSVAVLQAERGISRATPPADPNAHATHEDFWKSAKVVMPTPKEIVTMRLDADLLRWFRQHPGYQTRINAILRAYMQAHGSA
jgi:uncharacterized protein (DUF4415 family)